MKLKKIKKLQTQFFVAVPPTFKWLRYIIFIIYNMDKKNIIKTRKKIEKLLNTPAAKIIFSVILIFVSVLALSSPSFQDEIVEILGLNSAKEAIRLRELPEGVERARVAEVIDGDTIRLENGDRVRYLNIDTPETRRPGTPIQCYGPEASKFNKNLVEGKIIYMTADVNPADRYDRLLRFIFLGLDDVDDINKSVNARLVREGYAKASIYRPNTTYQDVFRALELEARANNIGIWKNCPKPFQE